MMELRHLRYFCAVADQGNFTRAANVIHLTQPALSRQIKDLESEIGVALFERTPNSIKLTPAGEIFYEEARDTLARIERGVRRVRGEITGEVLRIGYAPSLTAGIMPAAIEGFRSERPRVRLELAELADQVMIKQLEEGALDIALMAMRAGVKARAIRWTEFGQVSLVLVLPKSHRLAKFKRISAAKLAEEHFVGYDQTLYPEYHRIVRECLKAFSVTPRFVGFADGLTSLLTNLASQKAVAILPGEILKILPPALVIRPFWPALPSVTLGAGIPLTGSKHDADVFLRHLCASCRIQSRRFQPLVALSKSRRLIKN
jgi:LysR family transcriptional regulator, benzoate and cis,cis-muconate-responsive activator of ben and cat genes